MTETQEMTLPPGWEAIKSENKKFYYWNKKTGETTWNFPEQEAKQHVNMVRRHTYENIQKQPPLHSKSSPCLLLQQPPRSRRGAGRGVEQSTGSPRLSVGRGSGLSPGVAQISASSKKGYENVVLPEVQRLGSPVPQYEEIEGTHQDPAVPAPTRGRMASITSSNLSEPLSPSPPLPDRKYLDTDVIHTDLPNRHYTPPPGTAPKVTDQTCMSPTDEATRKMSTSSLHHAPMHQLSAMGNEYAIIERKQRKEVGVAAEGAGYFPPTLPLRAHQRMSREDLLANMAEEGGGANIGPEVTAAAEPVHYADLGMNSDHTPYSAPKDVSIAYSVVKLDPQTAKMGAKEREVPCPLSPQPYEVASPTPGSTPHHELNTDPHYEEIETKDDVSADGYMQVDHNRMTRPRGFSSPSSVDPAPMREQSPLPENSSLSPLSSKDGSIPAYDLPSNSRKLQALNVTLRRSTTPQTDYAKLSLSKEAILLRSGVTLRRHARESVSSLSSYASQMDGEEGGQDDRRKDSDLSDEEDALEPINKCIRSLETSLLNSGSPEAAEHFKMVLPPPVSPSWVNFKRRPHAYEEIMGASQEELDWDESDLTSAPPTPTVGEEEPCEMVKVEDSPSRSREPRVRVVHHQYEDVVLKGDEPTVQEGGVAQDKVTLKESWVDEEKEGAGLPRGWQRMRDEQQREYYWHIPTGRTQYSPPTAASTKKQHVSDGSPQTHSHSPVSHCFPARYLGWMPVSEDRLISGQCVKAVHACITKMAASVQDKEKQGEEVLLQVEGMEMQWLKPVTLSVMTVQLINRIRVWGIGLEDERDFGYVSRDSSTKKHRCHIFRCAMPARAVAHVMLETHQQQRKARHRARIQQRGQTSEHRAHTSQQTTPVTSPAQGDVPGPPATSNGAGPSGAHERYERFMCVYVGSCAIEGGQGMEVLNGAVERLSMQSAQWQDVCVDVAISSVTIADFKTGRVLKEHRVRYLAFLGIATDDKFCGYILDCGERNGEKHFRFYGFRMEPNTDRLCLSLHSACQARYRRVMEANARRHGDHARQPTSHESPQGLGGDTPQNRSTSSLLGKFGSLKKSKRTSIGEVKTFVVQYLGHQGVSRVDGLDTVRPVVQELAVNPKPNCPHLVEFDISPSGLSVREGQGKTASRKDFPVKCITYVVKIRNYFAFVAKERSKYICHAFMEYKIDAGTIVSTVQNTLVPQSSK